MLIYSKFVTFRVKEHVENTFESNALKFQIFFNNFNFSQFWTEIWTEIWFEIWTNFTLIILARWHLKSEHLQWKTQTDWPLHACRKLLKILNFWLLRLYFICCAGKFYKLITNFICCAGKFYKQITNLYSCAW